MEAVRMEELTSGASSRIIPVFDSLRRVFFFIQSTFLWFLLLLPRNLLWASSSSSSLSSPERISVFRKKDEEEALRRRALAEAREMISGTEEENICRWSTSVFYGVRRNALFCRSWIPISGEMKGIMVIIHGLNEHSGRYAHFARQLNSCSFGVYAMDWVGHGGSDGLHGYVPSLDHVVADTGAFLEKVKLENPEIPCFLFGHSAGGAVVLKAACYPRIKCMLEGIVLTSPALRVKPAHPMVKAVAPLLSLVAPRVQFKVANRRRTPVSRDPAAMVAKYTDPLVYTGPIRVRTGLEILRISSYLLRNMKSVTVPFLVLHGTADRVTDPLASQDLYNVAASEFKDIILYEGFLHDLLFEPEHEEVAGDIINWMEKRLHSR
ncbi:monoacylglycerol lipase-like [Macadamia integrifolia]|uniref:monoacylglycerol lipase-like n=1 Tax=Macadamia integrifolia TaxID=60698 RepID=UPI001C4E652C|nr:monoacylglycerol lipase-like [Macadamia integrifolia]